MSDWNAGYVSDVEYTHGYYQELNPLRVKLAFLNHGLVFPEMGAACELGFGQGVSTNFHAAGSITQWCGTDFNPTQAGFAQELAQASRSGARLFDEAFEEFAHREDLPDFDFIGVHGIWSWISKENHAVIVDFIRRKLKVGGVLYISYNALPGWAPLMPLRHLLNEHASVMNAEGVGVINRVDGAIDFAEKLLATNPTYARANPVVGERLKKLQPMNRHYLAHEYFNRDWLPIHFSDMAKSLNAAKLQFACSANFLDHIDAINLTRDQQVMLAEITDPVFRQDVRDYMVNQFFRKDYWVKGARKMNAIERVEQMRVLRVVLVKPRADISLKITAALGEANMSAEVYNPLLDLLADYKPKSLAQVEESLLAKGITLQQIVQAVTVLAAGSNLSFAQEDKSIAKAKKECERLNAHLVRKARGGAEVSYLVSPVTGEGVQVDRFKQLFLLARAQGAKQSGDWADFVWQTISAQGQKLIKDGETLESDEENLLELRHRAAEFDDKHLPVLKALQIA